MNQLYASQHNKQLYYITFRFGLLQQWHKAFNKCSSRQWTQNKELCRQIIVRTFEPKFAAHCTHQFIFVAQNVNGFTVRSTSFTQFCAMMQHTFSHSRMRWTINRVQLFALLLCSHTLLLFRSGIYLRGEYLIYVCACNGHFHVMCKVQLKLSHLIRRAAD